MCGSVPALVFLRNPHGFPKLWCFRKWNLRIQPIPLTTFSCRDYTSCFSFSGEIPAQIQPAFSFPFLLHMERPRPQRRNPESLTPCHAPAPAALGLPPGPGAACWTSRWGSWMPLTKTKWEPFCSDPDISET